MTASGQSEICNLKSEMDYTLPHTPADRPQVMGILNVTPDSFSDGGRYDAPGTAVAHALKMAHDGADLIDVGGESSRPGATRVNAAEQIARTAEVIRGCRAALDHAGFEAVAISIDTTRAAVAAAGLDAGAALVNDISAGEDDPDLFLLAADRGVPLVLMHKRGEPATMQDDPRYDDVVARVGDYLMERFDAATAAGLDPAGVAIDPGLGFGKSFDHNLALLAALRRVTALGPPVLLGASRKRFLARIAGCPDASVEPDPAGGSAATTAWAVAQGVRMVRVHDVRLHRQAADTAWAIVGAGKNSVQDESWDFS